MSGVALEGSFATPRRRLIERRCQNAGLAALGALIAAALIGVLAGRAIVIRSACVYVFLLAVFRVAGRRTLAQVTTFDLILVLVIGDATQQAIIGEDFTVAGGMMAVSTLLLLDVLLSRLKHRWPIVEGLLDGLPLPLVVHGRADREQMDSECVTDDDLLSAARETHGLPALNEIEHAVLETNGALSIVPRQAAGNGTVNS